MAFARDPQWKTKDEGGAAAGLAMAGISAIAMASVGQQPDQILASIYLTAKDETRRALIDNLLYAAARDYRFLPPLFLMADNPAFAKFGIRESLGALDIQHWAKSAEIEPQPLVIVTLLHADFQNPSAATALGTLDCSYLEKEISDNEGALLHLAPELLLMAELDNPSAWKILGSINVAPLEKILAGPERSLSHAQDAAHLLLGTVRSGGPQAMAALAALQLVDVDPLIDNIHDIPELLHPFLQIGNPSAILWASNAFSDRLFDMADQSPDGKYIEALITAIGVVYPYNLCFECAQFLNSETELGTPLAEPTLQSLIEKEDAVTPQTVIRLQQLLNRTAAFERFQPNPPSLGLPDFLFREQWLEKTAAQIARAWMEEPAKVEFFSQNSGVPLGLDLIPESFIETFLCGALEKPWRSSGPLRNPLRDRTPEQVEGDFEKQGILKELDRLILEFPDLSEEQRNYLCGEIATEWSSLSQTEKEAFAEASAEGPIPGAFLSHYFENRSALLRRWSDAEMGEDHWLETTDTRTTQKH